MVILVTEKMKNAVRCEPSHPNPECFVQTFTQTGVMDSPDILNSEQQEAIGFGEGQLLVLAGAGSGKTRVVTMRIIRLLERGVDPHRILGVTFTNKAAGEMRNRVNAATNADVLISTFHSLGARILRESIQHLGYRSHFTIYDEDDVTKVLKTCLDEVGVGRDRDILKNVRHSISHAKNALRSPDNCTENLRNAQNVDLFQKIYRRYTELLFQYNAVDFDDLLYLPVRLLREFPEVLDYYQSRWHYLLIDEYQDTNVAQYELIRTLVEKRGNLCVVGDPDQSIYSWRGADVRNILDFEKDYPGAKVIRLEQNYRSTTHILDAANAVIKKNESRYEKNLWSNLGPGEKIGVFYGPNENDETRFVVDCIRYHRTHNDVPLNRIAIFYRTNFQSRAFEDRFMSMGIPYVIVGGVSFYQRREIKDIMAYLRMVQSSTDMVAWERTLTVPKRGIGDSTIDKIRNTAEAHELPIFEFCQGLIRGEHTSPNLPAKQKAALVKYVELIEGLRRLEGQVPLMDMVKAAINLTGYLEYLQADQETFEDRSSNLQELVSKASEWSEQRPDGTLRDFLEELSLKASIDEVDEFTPRVSLMTIHSGKGLEFPVTFLVGMEEDLFPHINSKDDNRALEEERRLCYVGMTRAERYLYISHVGSRNLWGVRRAMRGSRFLKDIPRQHIQLMRAAPSPGDRVKDDEENEVEHEPRVVYDVPSVFSKNPKPAERTFAAGDVVFHREFGIGTIMEVYEGSAGLTYKVHFSKDGQTRSLVARLASLSPLG